MTFDSGSPGLLTSNVKIVGLGAGENIVGLDSRPANGVVYGLSSANKVYTLNPFTGLAQVVTTTTPEFVPNSKSVGIDFPSLEVGWHARQVADQPLYTR